MDKIIKKYNDYLTIPVDKEFKMLMKKRVKVLHTTISKFARQMLIDKFLTIQLQNKSFDELVDAVCLETGIDRNVIFMRTRKREIVEARQVLAQLMKDYIRPEKSLSWIGSKIGGYDHSTVLHCFKQVRDVPQINAIYNQLKTKIENGSI